MCGGGHHHHHSSAQKVKMEAQYEAARLELARLQKMETESDEGLGHSGSSDDEKCVKKENLENVGEDGKRKEDLYKCRYCDRTFCYLCHLKVHERVHTGEKPYKCTFCDCTFSQLGSLTVHMRIHTGEKPYECRICLKKFRHINSLRRHQRQVHRKTPAEVDAAPRGGDQLVPTYHQKPALHHPYAQFQKMPAQARIQPMKSALEIRQQQSVWNPYAFQMHAQMQAQRAQQMALQHQAIMASRTATPTPPKGPTNHSISAMINEPSSPTPTLNKPKKHSFSISALVGEDSDHESNESHDSAQIEEIVDVVSDQNSEIIEPANSPYSNGGNSDSADSGHNSLIDDDLRRALTIDPNTLSVDEKQRLRRKLAEIALRNISSDSGVCAEVC